jgi:GNAT superfamily N-acetyltransferase
VRAAREGSTPFFGTQRRPDDQKDGNVEIIKTRDLDAADRAANIWAHATAKRDEDSFEPVDFEEAIPLIRETLSSSDRAFLLALYEDDKMMVFAAIGPARGSDDPAAGEIRYMGVAPGHWGEGWARRILVGVPGAMRDAGFTRGELWVYADNIRAIFVYEAMGWQGTNETRRHAVTGRIEQKFVLKL